MKAVSLKLWLLFPALVLLGAVLGPAVAGGTQGVIGGVGIGALISALCIWVFSTEALAPAWLQRVHRLAQVAYVLLLLVVAYGIIAGVLTVLLWHPRASWEAFNRPYQLQGIGMLLVFLFSLPALVTAVWYVSRRDRKAAKPLFLVFVGPILVFIVGDGLTPHLEIPWHHIAHTLSGLLPMTVLYTLVLRKWYPSLLDLRLQPHQENVSP